MATLAHEVWLYARTIMGCVILTLEDRTARRRVETSYPLSAMGDPSHWHRTMERLDARLGYPIKGRA